MSTRSCVCLAVLGFVAFLPAIASAQAPGKGADACSIVSKAEIEQALGVKLQDGQKDPKMENPGVLSSCDYGLADGGTVSVLLRRNATKYVPGTEKAEFEKQGMKLRYTNGLGTTAAFIDMMGVGTGLFVFRGDYDYLQVSAMLTKIAPEKLEGIARLVLTRWK